MPYQNPKHHRVSTRANWWNYNSAGFYFITICTKHRDPYFGKVSQGLMELSEIGNIAFNEWLKTPDLRPDMNITLDEFIIMPNHMHAILAIGKNEYNDLRMDSVFSKNEFGPQVKNLASIIRGFKASVTTQARNERIDFNWQRGYHDHIIRDDEAYQNIKHYIRQNPRKWQEDRFYNSSKV